MASGCRLVKFRLNTYYLLLIFILYDHFESLALVPFSYIVVVVDCHFVFSSRITTNRWVPCRRAIDDDFRRCRCFFLLFFFSRFNDFRCKNKIFIMDWHLKIETAREWKEGQMKKKKMIVNIVSFFFSWISVGGTRWINNNNKWDKSVVKYELLLRCRVRLHVTYDAGWVVGSREFEHRNHSPSLRQQFIYPYHFHKFAHINAQPLVYSTFNYTFCRLHPLRALGAAHTTQVCNWSWLNGGKFKFLTLMALSDGKYNR